MKASKTRQEVPAQLHRALAGDAGTQKNRQQLGLGERSRPQLEQPLARTFVFGPIGNAHRDAPVPWCRVILNCATSERLDRMDDSPAMNDSAKPLQRVVLGLTGGIAAYKAAELTRLLVKEGIAVDVVMTEAATKFIAPMTMQALSGKPVLTDLWESGSDNAMGHIDLSRHADAIVVAPASADFIAKLAHGLADDLLSALCLARDCSLLIAPAMNVQMWTNAATQRNVATLRTDAIEILGPGSGDQACGEIGDGRMLEPEEILAALFASAQPKLLTGKRVLLTAGPTFEAIDPVRGITNSSSGKMGFAMAQACSEAGAEVTLVAGPSALE